MKQQIRYYKQDGTEYDFSKTLKIRITQTSNADMNIGVQKQKTAMQELIEYLNGDTYAGICDIRDRAEELLEKEKEQIMKAYCDGFDELLPFHENDYYNQTYNQNK
jgi:hypothetical protein